MRACEGGEEIWNRRLQEGANKELSGMLSSTEKLQLQYRLYMHTQAKRFWPFVRESVCVSVKDGKKRDDVMSILR